MSILRRPSFDGLPPYCAAAFGRLAPCLLLSLALLSPTFGESSPTEAAEQEVPTLDVSSLSPPCANQVFALKEKALVETPYTRWSEDLLIRAVLVGRRQLSEWCSVEDNIDQWITRWQAEYLQKMGWPLPLVGPDQTVLFNGFLGNDSERNAIQTALKSLRVRSFGPAIDPIALLAQIYQQARVLNGVLVVGGRGVELAELDKVVRRLCGAREVCRFWDPAVVAKIVLTPASGIASFVASNAELILSKSLLEFPKRLHRIVIAHELTHVAIHSALREKQSWVEEFRGFSGWSRVGAKQWNAPSNQLERRWNDLLDKQSEGSPFSLLPDPVMARVQSDAASYDGFVFAKTYRRVKESGDPSEDLADHVAAFHYARHRFCLGREPIAPEKFAWIAREVFGTAETLSCIR